MSPFSYQRLTPQKTKKHTKDCPDVVIQFLVAIYFEVGPDTVVAFAAAVAERIAVEIPPVVALEIQTERVLELH